MDLQGQLEKMAHGIVSGPGLSDSIEIAVVGGAIGGLIGYLKDRDRKGATSAALWGAGLGVAGQYMLFHALKPALKTFGRTAHTSALATPVMQMVPRHAARGEFVGNDSSPEAAGWGHGEMMGAVPYPYYDPWKYLQGHYAWWE
jgi:hypothetical protein